MLRTSTIQADDERKPFIAAKEQTQTAGHRLQPLDTLRGVIIIVMALDHIADLSGSTVDGEYWFNRTLQLQGTDFISVLQFLTRFITHMCAIGFFFLMGLGMVYLYESRTKAGWTKLQILRHFMIRGIVLIILQFVCEDPVWCLSQYTNNTPHKIFFVVFGILQALGLSMILSSWFLVLDRIFTKSWQIKNHTLKLGTIIMCVACFVCFFSTELIVHYAEPTQNYNPLLRLLWIAGPYHQVYLADCTIPWLGLTLFGNLYGKLFVHLGDENNERRYRIMFFNGLFFLGVFAFLRVLGVSGVFWFGDLRLPPHHTAQQFAVAMFSLSKYPPSLVFVCLFVGWDMILAFFIHKIQFYRYDIASAANAFGKSSLFFYCVHLWLYLFLGFLFNRARYQLPIYYTYPTWSLGLLILYPLCLRFGSFKARQRYDSIWKLF
eukprot:TRINITY_DN6268_c0_g1_i1.p1 TRINITY_DN6268_c0_g1~~TRINITY_DN6268_c0_g1_i1.p1  ORF type:complete len:434 (+),score=29.84 TRINITY_DN6268_c0_g1_i1:111-1412(+)